MPEHGLDAERGAWPGVATLAQRQVTEVGRVQPICVLGRRDPGHRLGVVQAGRDGVLDEEAVDPWVGVQLVDRVQHVRLGGAGGEPEVD